MVCNRLIFPDIIIRQKVVVYKTFSVIKRTKVAKSWLWRSAPPKDPAALFLSCRLTKGEKYSIMKRYMNDQRGQEIMRGRFIVFEGIDGAGKTTQIERLAERLRAEGRKVAITAEPTTSTTGKMLREALAGRDLRTAAEMAALFVG